MANPHEGLQLVATSLVVTDLEKTTRFYCETFGFRQGQTKDKFGEPNSDLAKIVGVPTGCKYRARMLLRPEIIIAISQFEEPAAMREWVRDPRFMMARGIIMLFNCPDMEAVKDRALKYGGHIDYDGKSDAEVAGRGRVPAPILADPDGYRIQLTSSPAAALKAHLDK